VVDYITAKQKIAKQEHSADKIVLRYAYSMPFVVSDNYETCGFE